MSAQVFASHGIMDRETRPPRSVTCRGNGPTCLGGRTWISLHARLSIAPNPSSTTAGAQCMLSGIVYTGRPPALLLSNVSGQRSSAVARRTAGRVAEAITATGTAACRSTAGTDTPMCTPTNSLTGPSLMAATLITCATTLTPLARVATPARTGRAATRLIFGPRRTATTCTRDQRVVAVECASAGTRGQRSRNTSTQPVTVGAGHVARCSGMA